MSQSLSGMRIGILVSNEGIENPADTTHRKIVFVIMSQASFGACATLAQLRSHAAIINYARRDTN